MEQGHNCTFILSAGFGSGGDGAECFPNNGFADVGCDKEGDSWADTISLFEHLVEHHDDDSSEGELENDEDGIACSDLLDVTVHSGPNIGEGLAHANDNTQDYRGNFL